MQYEICKGREIKENNEEEKKGERKKGEKGK